MHFLDQFDQIWVLLIWSVKIFDLIHFGSMLNAFDHVFVAHLIKRLIFLLWLWIDRGHVSPFIMKVMFTGLIHWRKSCWIRIWDPFGSILNFKPSPCAISILTIFSPFFTIFRFLKNCNEVKILKLVIRGVQIS